MQNEYLKLLTDKTTLNKDYKITSDIKKGLYEKGGEGMSNELRAIIDEEREEVKITTIMELVKDGVLNVVDAATRLKVSVEKFEEMMDQYSKSGRNVIS